MGLGFTINSSGWKQAVAAFVSFIVMVVVQFIFRLYEDGQTTGNYPSEFSVYMMLLGSLVVSLIFYGYNKKTEKKE